MILALMLFVAAAMSATFAVSRADADMVGIDVSKWQGTVDWEQVKEHAGFALIKAGGDDEGPYVDVQFARNRDEARRLGIPHGFYYYAGGGDPIQEADHFANIVGKLEPGEVVAFDLEIDHPDPVGYALQFLVRAEQQLGVKPLLYTNMNRVWGHDWRAVVNNGNPLWGAIYDDFPDPMPAPGFWPEVTIKQFTSSGVIPGISNHSVDMNYFRKGAEDFKALGAPEPPPVVVTVVEEEVAPPVTSIVVPDEVEYEINLEATDAGVVVQADEADILDG